jgi:predicted heme/steroid binding protein
MVMEYAGKDATEAWEAIHRPEHLERYAEHLVKKGKLQASGGLVSWLLRRVNERRQQTPWLDRLQLLRRLLGKREEFEQPGEENANDEGEEEESLGLQWTAEHESELPPGGVFDVSELSRWDGVNLPMCIGVCGVVVDVSSSSNFVPDFGYGKLWAGKDTTWAMATVSLKAEDANKFDFAISDLNEDQFKALAGWYKHFTTKYRKIGTLRELEDWDFTSVVESAAQLPTSEMSKG